MSVRGEGGWVLWNVSSSCRLPLERRPDEEGILRLSKEVYKRTSFCLVSVLKWSEELLLQVFYAIKGIVHNAHTFGLFAGNCLHLCTASPSVDAWLQSSL